MKRRPSPLVRRKLQPTDKTGKKWNNDITISGKTKLMESVTVLSALCSLDSGSDPGVSIQTELALEQLKQNHSQELQQLNIQLETQVAAEHIRCHGH